MKHKIFAFAACIVCSWFSFLASAESTVYVFYPDAMSATPQNQSNRPEATLGINGQYDISVYGNHKKTFDDPVYGFTYPMYYYSAGVQKLIFNEEGKVIITYEFNHVNGKNGAVTPYRSEIQLDLEDGVTYYVEVSRKKGKELSEKKGLKKLNNKDLHVMPEWIQP